jgi:hypothetical protein
MAVPNIFSAGTLAKSSEVNENFEYVDDLYESVNTIVPIGTILPWLKTFNQNTTGTPTSTSINKLIDSSETFVTNEVLENSNIKFYADEYSSVTTYNSTSSTYVSYYTHTFSAISTNGEYIVSVSNQLKNNSSGQTIYCRVKFYYTDSTTDYSNEESQFGGTYVTKTYTNPNPAKLVNKIDFEIKDSLANSGSAINTTVPAITKWGKIISVDSETQLTLDSDIATSAYCEYFIYSTPMIDDNFVECNGQVLDDSDSIFNGMTIPDLNNSSYIVGGLESGTISTFGGSGSTYPNYSVVYIMRVK